MRSAFSHLSSPLHSCRVKKQFSLLSCQQRESLQLLQNLLRRHSADAVKLREFASLRRCQEEKQGRRKGGRKVGHTHGVKYTGTQEGEEDDQIVRMSTTGNLVIPTSTSCCGSHSCHTPNKVIAKKNNAHASSSSSKIVTLTGCCIRMAPLHCPCPVGNCTCPLFHCFGVNHAVHQLANFISSPPILPYSSSSSSSSSLSASLLLENASSPLLRMVSENRQNNNGNSREYLPHGNCSSAFSCSSRKMCKHHHHDVFHLPGILKGCAEQNALGVVAAQGLPYSVIREVFVYSEKHCVELNNENDTSCIGQEERRASSPKRNNLGDTKCDGCCSPQHHLTPLVPCPECWRHLCQVDAIVQEKHGVPLQLYVASAHGDLEAASVVLQLQCRLQRREACVQKEGN